MGAFDWSMVRAWEWTGTSDWSLDAAPEGGLPPIGGTAAESLKDREKEETEVSRESEIPTESVHVVAHKY